MPEVEERTMKCLRCMHEWRGAYWNKDADVPIERHCPKCHSNSVRALKPEKK
jgi:hypothetical protein